MVACYERKSSAAAPVVYCIILLGDMAIPKNRKKEENGNKNRKVCSVWQKTLAFAHIATTCLNITSVLKLAHFIRYGSHMVAIYATRASSCFSITVPAEQNFIRNFRDPKHRNARE